MRTLQQAFDLAAGHLLRQGTRSRSAGQCLYRGPAGLRCGVGALIPDELYRVGLEGCLVNGPAIRGVLADAGWPVTDEFKRLVSRLQTIHDDFPVIEWRTTLRFLAMGFELATDVTDELGLR